ncbi:MAG: TetR/AcrR family transcriptional regulator [Deltaproteobacteria bacterium]|nr:TetR/AcrR family transcriptional regulator [Nannocystaceae bacterium]
MARPKGDIDTRIVHAARARFLTEGVDGSSLRAIAKDAGTNVGMIYYYFPTKDDLFLAVVDNVYTALLDDLTVALSPEHDVRERFQRVYRRIASLSDVEFDVIRIVVREALVSSSRLQRLFERFTQGHVPMLLRALQEGLGDGTFDGQRPLPAVFAALASTAIFPQLILRRIVADLPTIAGIVPAPEAMADALFDIVLHGAAPSKR